MLSAGVNEARKRSNVEENCLQRISFIRQQQCNDYIENYDEYDHSEKETNDKSNYCIAKRVCGVNKIHPSILQHQKVSSSSSSELSTTGRYSISRRLKLKKDDKQRKNSSAKIHTENYDDENNSIYTDQSDNISDNTIVSKNSWHLNHEIAQKRHCFVILPNNKHRISWDIFMAWLLAWMSFYVPYRVCMYWEEEIISNTIFWLEISTEIAFTIDILLNFFTAYYDPKTNMLVVSIKFIAIRYIKGFFFVDALATFPFRFIISNNNLGVAGNIGKLGRLPKMIKFLKAMRLLKLLRVYKLQQYITRLEVEYNIHHGISRLLKIMLMVLLVTHVVGCFWHLVGLSGGINIVNGGWIFRQSFSHKTLTEKYVASLYWAFSTLTTVGYGDISARTPQEQVYSMVMMLLGVSWYAYVVSSMSTVMSTFNAQNKAVRDKMMCVNEFIRNAKLPKPLAKHIRDFFEFKLSRSQRTFLMCDHYDADLLLDEMNSILRSDVILYLERELVDKIPFFRDKMPQFIADMICMLQPVIVQSGDFIIREGDQADEMFFLIKGKASIYYGDKRVKTINEGSYFGEIGCLMGGVRRAGVKALCTCELQALSKRKLNILLAEYPGVVDELKSIAEKRTRETVHRLKFKQLKMISKYKKESCNDISDKDDGIITTTKDGDIHELDMCSNKINETMKIQKDTSFLKEILENKKKHSVHSNVTNIKSSINSDNEMKDKKTNELYDKNLHKIQNEKRYLVDLFLGTLSPNIEAMVNEKLQNIMQGLNEQIKNHMEMTMYKFQSENNILVD